MASTSRSKEQLTTKRSLDGDLEVIENGGLSPQPSIKTEDDICSEIIRIEQGPADGERLNALERITHTLQVGITCLML